MRILGNIIGNVAIHKILLKYTNKPESAPHLKAEIQVYGENAEEIAQEFNWNDDDKLRILEESLKKFTHDIEKYYGDVNFPESEVPGIIDETIKELLD